MERVHGQKLPKQLREEQVKYKRVSLMILLDIQCRQRYKTLKKANKGSSQEEENFCSQKKEMKSKIRKRKKKEIVKEEIVQKEVNLEEIVQNVNIWKNFEPKFDEKDFEGYQEGVSDYESLVSAYEVIKDFVICKLTF